MAKKYASNPILGSRKGWRFKEGLTSGIIWMLQTALAVPSAPREGWGGPTVEGEHLCHGHKATHHSKVDVSQSEIPLLAYFVGGSRVAKPLVVVSCLIQSVVAGCCKPHHCFLDVSR